MQAIAFLVALLGASLQPDAPSKEEAAQLATQKMARVGTREISALDFRRELEYQWQITRFTTGKPATDSKQIRTDVMRELIDNALLQTLADRAKIIVSDEEVEKEFGRRKRSFPSAKGFQEYLAHNSYTEAELREELRRVIAAQHFVEQQTAGLSVSEQDLLREYARQRQTGLFNRPTRTADIRHVFARAEKDNPESWAEAEKKIRIASNRIADGEPIEKVAGEMSDDAKSAANGGFLIEAMPGKVLKEYEARIFTQEIGKVSEPFKSAIGWHILMVVGVNEPGVIPMEKVRARLTQDLLDPQRAQIIGTLLDDARKSIEVVEYAKPDEKATKP